MELWGKRRSEVAVVLLPTPSSVGDFCAFIERTDICLDQFCQHHSKPYTTHLDIHRPFFLF